MLPLKLLQISDLHNLQNPDETFLGMNTAHYFQAVLEQAFAQHQRFDALLVTGDLAQQPVAETYRHIGETLAAYRTPTACLSGNHDDWELMKCILNQGLITCNRQLIFDHWQVILLNSQKKASTKGWLAESELHFLTDCLKKYPDHAALIAVHHHCIPSESAWLDTMMIGNSAEFFSQLVDFPQVKVISTGHVHQIIDTTHAGIRVLGTPSTCFQFKPHCADFTLDNTAPGYRVLWLYPNGAVESQVFRLPQAVPELNLATESY